MTIRFSVPQMFEISSLFKQKNSPSVLEKLFDV